MTEKHYLLSNDELEEKFKNCKLSPKHLTHEAHLRIAYLYIQKYGVKQAIKNISKQLINFDSMYGNGTKFNQRLTIAATKVVELYMQKTSATNFKDMLLEYPQLRSNFCEILRNHYKLDFFKEEKEEEYVEPSLAVVG